MPAPANILLAPLGALYGAVTRTRLKLYKMGALATQEIDASVISVGNITTGGTGKTPLVARLARHLAECKERACILTRGYGRAHPSRQVLVSDGERLFADALEAGDEPRLLAEILQGVAAVICNADRAAAARWAVEKLQSSAFILDDGFQHLALARDLNLVAIDAMNPWGGGRLLPRGRLRGPLKGLARADAIIITRANLVSGIDDIRAQAERLSRGKPVILSQAQTVRTRRLGDDSRADEGSAVSDSTLRRTAAFCALGNPQSFFAHLGRDGYELVHTKSFRDHHVYTQRDLDELTQEAKRHGAQSLATTAKDAVKLSGLRFELPCDVIEIDVTFDDEEKLFGMVNEVLRKSTQRRGQASLPNL